ncbi:WD40-repeat-containing domain protein [Paraphysoderma sedebokerense]|nr:WD40-repeat-containing domain protein [Paraphysoderma sedebokerense]
MPVSTAPSTPVPKASSPQIQSAVQAVQSVAPEPPTSPALNSAPDDTTQGSILAYDDDDDLPFDQLEMDGLIDSTSEEEGEENLENVVKRVNEKNLLSNISDKKAINGIIQPTVTKRPEVIDDFIRNYLSRKGLKKALEAFQNEWYEFLQKGQLSPEDVILVPDVYHQIQDLDTSIKKLRVDLENSKEIANKARATFDKLRKERDFHRMHHKRVVQEKSKLTQDIKRLNSQHADYENQIKQIQQKYELTLKEKTMIKLERDKLAAKLVSIESSNVQEEPNPVMPVSKRSTPSPTSTRNEPKSITSPTHPAEPSKPKPKHVVHSKLTVSKEALLPVDDRTNPFCYLDLASATVEKLKCIHSVKAHDAAINSMKFHPKKMVIATCSNDMRWKMWGFPRGDLLMAGDGHKSWIFDCDFHPRGSHLATASGDLTIKIWDFTKGAATGTLVEHTKPAKGVAFHDTGDFLASCSQDGTAKLWDMTALKCRQIFHGHNAAVNSVAWLPYTNTICTASMDKTLSFWDCRSGNCTQTFFGHGSGINQVTFSLRGTTFASCDVDGTLKLWDPRMINELQSITISPHSVNKLSFDPSGTNVGVGSSNGNVYFYNTLTNLVTQPFNIAHQGGVQAVLFDSAGGEYFVTSGTDGTFKIWN